MGGYGSGRRPGKTLTTEMLDLDVRFLHRRGYLRSASPSPMIWQRRNGFEPSSIHIRVRGQQLFLNWYVKENDGKWNPVNMFIKLDWTPCHFGGYRPWFLCPRCGRRAAILYAGQYFYCRVCRDLAYPSENEGRLDRLYRQANKIRRRLNCEPGALSPINIPPKGMHEKTFDLLRDQVLVYEERALRLLWGRLQRNKG